MRRRFPSRATTPRRRSRRCIWWSANAARVASRSSCSESGPVAISTREIFFGINPRADRLVDQCNTDRDAGAEWSQLFESLDLLERMFGEIDPTHQCRPLIRVHSNVLPDVRALKLGVVAIAQERNCSP